MSVWYAIPSKRESGGTLPLWRERGYYTAVMRDPEDVAFPADLVITCSYPGYARAVNSLCRVILLLDSTAEWIVTGGDDVEPDPRDPNEIAAECAAHFSGTFGLMQPTGDGHRIEHICGSPWLGREFIERMNGGAGPFWPEYTHMFGDQELQDVSKKLGVMWQRSDLRHRHHHWSWSGDRRMPEFLKEVSGQEHWDRFMKLYSHRRAAGFPGHEPLAVADGYVNAQRYLHRVANAEPTTRK